MGEGGGPTHVAAGRARWGENCLLLAASTRTRLRAERLGTGVLSTGNTVPRLAAAQLGAGAGSGGRTPLSRHLRGVAGSAALRVLEGSGTWSLSVLAFLFDLYNFIILFLLVSLHYFLTFYHGYHFIIFISLFLSFQ